jgi:hypothetical protein
MSEPEAMSGESFARHVLNTNPFTQDRVTGVQASQTDVGSIHDKAFKKLVKRIDDVRAGGPATGVLLTGSAGVGKSHVLARLFRWAREEGRATVVYLHNILASPERTGRYLLHATVNDLAGYRPANFAQSELYALINLAIGARLEGKTRGMAPNLALRKEVLQHIGQEIDPDQLVMPVFITYLEQAVGANLAEEAAEARALAAVQWLSGETIDPEIARSIGLRVNGEDGARIADDVAVQRTLDVICRLCACANRPFVLCLDQVDNLSNDRVKALASFLHAAIDNGRNLVVLTSGVKESLDRLERDLVIPLAATDRIAQHRVNLESISAKDARAIVVERIEKFSAPFAKVKKIAAARAAEPLTPLSERWWQKYSAKLIEARPRDVIRAARDAWEAEQERVNDLGTEAWLKTLGKAKSIADTDGRRPLPPLEERIDQLVALKITEAVNARRLKPERLPPDADNMATLTLTLLEGCVQVDGYTLRSIEPPTIKERSVCYNLWATEQSPNGTPVSNGLTFFASDSAQSATNMLKRLLNSDAATPTHQYLITDDERRPLKLATKGHEVYEALSKSSRFEHLRLRFDDHAQLDALSSVLGAARVGDLEVEAERGVYRALTEAECRASLHRKRLFLEHPLLHQLLTEEAAPKPEPPSVAPGTVLQLRSQIKGELAMALAMSAREMATIIIDRTSRSQDAFPKIWQMVKDVAQQMSQANELFVDAQDDDLYLQLA